MSEDWLHLFEGRLEQLEQLAAEDRTSFSDLLTAAKASLQSLAAIAGQELWLARPDGIERLENEGHFQPQSADANRRIADAPGQRSQFVVATHKQRFEELLVTCPLAQSVCCVLQIPFEEIYAPRQSFADGAAVVLDIISGYLSRQLLSQSEQRLQTQATLMQLVSHLHRCQTLREAASVIVQEGTVAVGDCRIAFFVKCNGAYKIYAITGIREPKPESETVRALESVIADFADRQDSDPWQQLPKADEDNSIHSLSLLAQNGVTGFGAFPLSSESTPADSASNIAVLSVEVFDDAARPNESVMQQLVSLSAPVIEKLYRQEQTGWSRLTRSRRTRWLIALVAAMFVLTVWPATFEVEVPGKIVSADRRRIFAPEHGTIDAVLFQNEATVEAGQTLLKMSNADLNLELQRVQGDIDTTAARLASVKARRLTENDPQLSSDEQQLQQQLENNQKQLKLVTRQLSTLEVMAPFAGVVFRRDPQHELISRPVQRGQLLLEIVPVDSEWQLELSIPDHFRSYVVEYRNSTHDSQDVRYMVVSMPEQDWTTTLSTVDNAVQIDDGKLVCRATATLSKLPGAVLRPGTSVIARIDCGQRSLGFVMFREIVEFWHHVRFAWF